MLSNGRKVLTLATWVAGLPGLSIVAAVIVSNCLGEGWRRAFDPQRVPE